VLVRGGDYVGEGELTEMDCKGIGRVEDRSCFSVDAFAGLEDGD
jgi:hypothetical protein